MRATVTQNPSLKEEAEGTVEFTNMLDLCGWLCRDLRSRICRCAVITVTFEGGLVYYLNYADRACQPHVETWSPFHELHQMLVVDFNRGQAADAILKNFEVL